MPFEEGPVRAIQLTRLPPHDELIRCLSLLLLPLLILVVLKLNISFVC